MVEPKAMVVMGTTAMPMNAGPLEARGMLEAAGRSAQPILKLLKITGCTCAQLAATTNDVVNSRGELQLTLHGFCVEWFREVGGVYA